MLVFVLFVAALPPCFFVSFAVCAKCRHARLGLGLGHSHCMSSQQHMHTAPRGTTADAALHAALLQTHVSQDATRQIMMSTMKLACRSAAVWLVG